MLSMPCLHCSDLKTSYKFGTFLEKLTFFYNSDYILNGTLLIIIFSYQDKRISNWFRIVSLDILILKKQQISKFQKIDQSYLVGVLKVTPKLQSKLLIWKTYKHKNTLFFLFTHSPMFFFPNKTPKKWQFIFIYNNYINFIYASGNFDWLIKVTPSVIKVTPSAIKVTPFGGATSIGLWFRISSKNLIITYGKESYRT